MIICIQKISIMSIGLYYLRTRYMNRETGTVTSIDTYERTLDNSVSLHKYLNAVMYTDLSGYFYWRK